MRKRNQKARIIPCSICGTDIKVQTQRFELNKSGNFYCSHACRGKSRRTGEPYVDADCASCGKPIRVPRRRAENSKSGALYCSKKCYGENSKRYSRRRHGGEYQSARREVLMRHTSCQEDGCDIDLLGILEVHHIDGDHNNNSADNLTLLCKNHHGMRHLRPDGVIDYTWVVGQDGN